MKRSSIKWRIFKYNLIVIVPVMLLMIVIFNIAVNIYIQREIIDQLTLIGSHTEQKALVHGPDFYPRPQQNDHGNGGGESVLPMLQPQHGRQQNKQDDLFHFYFMLDQSLRESLTVLSADFMLFDTGLGRMNPTVAEDNASPAGLEAKIVQELRQHRTETKETYEKFKLRAGGSNYVAIIRPVAHKNNFGLGFIVIYSNLQKVEQLQYMINVILILVLVASLILVVLFSTITSKRITQPLVNLSTHMKELADRNFSYESPMPEEEELISLVMNVNTMAEKLAEYDKAQKTFLQNASHELRTPLMSIQSYAEGIQYEVVEPKASAKIILEESKRLTGLVESLLYLSRLDAIQEYEHFELVSLQEVVASCLDKMKGIAEKAGIVFQCSVPAETCFVQGEEEKLLRAFINIVSNGIRHAGTVVGLELERAKSDSYVLRIYDDGIGFDAEELPYIFDRFYKGKKGNFGLGLAIAQSIIEKHRGTIMAYNRSSLVDGTCGALFEICLPQSPSIE